QMKYTVVVGVDVPTEYYPGGKYTGVEIVNNQYNVGGVAPSGARIFALPPASSAAASKVGAPAAALLAKNPAPSTRTLMSAEDPLPKPKLTLQKTVVGGRDESITEPIEAPWKYRLLPMQMNGKTPTYFVINDTLKTSDGRVTFLLCVGNSGETTAQDIFVRDVLPDGFVFEGFIAINGDLKPGDLPLSHFYDKTGKQLAANPAQFANYRSFDLWLGDLAPGQVKTIYYQAYTTKIPNAKPISSFSGGVAGILNPKVSGLQYSSKSGFFVKSRELHFPVNGQPAQVDLIVGDPLVANFAVDPIISRSGMSLGEQVEIQIPYEISGTSSLAVDPTMTFTVPKGYKIEQVSLQVNDPQSLSRKTLSTAIQIKDTTAGKEVKMKLGNNRVAFPTVRLSFDEGSQTDLITLRDKNGHTGNPLNFFATITGGYSVSTTAKAALGSFGVPFAEEAGTTTGNLRAASTVVRVDAQSNPEKDSAIFVGRSAPMFVRRGNEFQYTIFVGNQTLKHLGSGTISMMVPKGCVATRATMYQYNARFGSDDETSGKFGSIIPAGKATPSPPGTGVSEINWTPNKSNTLITWDIGKFGPAEGGAVTLTVKVDENFVGDRIDDDTCWFRVANAMDKTAGPLGVIVLPKNVETAAPEIVQKSIEGMGLKYTTAAGNALSQRFRVGTNSCGITIGGANYAQLEDSTVIIMLPDGRVMAIGQPQKLDDFDQARTFTRIVRDGPELRILVGPGTASERSDSTIAPDGVVLINAPGYPGIRTANSILSDFVKSGVSLLSKRKAIVVVGGGPTFVQTGANTLAGADGSAKVAPPPVIKKAPAPQPVLVTKLTAEGTALLSHNGNAIVAGGGGNIVAGGGGNIVAGGGGNIVAGGGGNVVANDGAGIVAGGGGNIVAGGGGNIAPALVSQQSGAIVAAGGGNLIGQDGAGIVAGGGGNIVAGGGGNAIPR
ncbi:MAG TPA: hypothetical protein VD994_05375, partial [Prosthecobacter sp.]|nr:hypothetical protein [Prosthecobacter sp.]